MKNLIFVLFLILTNISAFAEEGSPESFPDFESAFQSGVTAYRGKDYNKAATSFSQALGYQKHNVAALSNLALAQYQLGQKGLSLGLLRKALDLDPDDTVSRQAHKFIQAQLDVKEIPHEITALETLRSSLLIHFSLPSLLIITALFLGSAGWVLITYWGGRRRALREEKPFPPVPVIGLFLGFGLILFASLTMLKGIDLLSPRATIIAEKISAFALPDEKSTSLFELYGGLEVVVEQKKEDWAQVTYPGGLTGWVPFKSIYQTSGRTIE